MIEAKYQKKFEQPKNFPGNWAFTLNPEDIGQHPSGWVVTGEIIEDYYEWVNSFQARHPEKGMVWGDFEDIVYATSQEAYDDFVKNHPPGEWDYWDI